MARITKLVVEGFRSIRDPIEIRFPQNTPLVLLGENNAGKSNIIRSVDLILGEWWPGSHIPEDHEFWDRKPENGPIVVRASFEGMLRYDRSVDQLSWRARSDSEPEFKALLDNGTDQFVSKAIRDQCMCFAVGADRRLSYQLSYTSKFTLLAKLMRRFHSKLTEDQGRVERLKEKFGEIRQIFDEVAEFGDFQSELRTQFGEMFGGMSYGLQVDFSAYDPSNFFHSLRMQAVENETIRSLEELGTGQEQLLALAFAQAYAKAFFGGILLAIEEPEAHLHPLAQQWLAAKVRAMCTDGLQLMLTTHSPEFVDLLGIPGCVLVKKSEGSTIACQLSSQELTDHCVEHGASPERTRVDTILPFYEGCATKDIKAGLFARKTVLVEGLTEALALPIYLSKVGLDVTKEGIAVIPVMGKGNLAKWWRFFTAYKIPTYVTFDNDSEHDTDGNKRKDALRAIGITDQLIKDVLEVDDWFVGPSYTLFGTDFEDCLRASFDEYEDLEAEAQGQIGPSKPLVARYVADALERNDEQIGWKNLIECAEALRALALPSSPAEPTVVDDLPF